MKIISASDFHIEDDSHLDAVLEFYNMVMEEKPNLLVLNGDIGDPWKAKWHDILQTESWVYLRRLTRIRSFEGLKNVCINRNHDYNMKQEHLPFAELKGSYRVGNFMFLHGWEFDITWRGLGKIWGVAPIAFWLSMNMPKLMIPIYKLLYGNKTPAKEKEEAITIAGGGISLIEAGGVSMLRWGHPEDGLEKLDEWNKHIGIMHGRAMNYAVKNNVVLIMGHTHCPTNYNYKIFDDGDMVDSFSYVYIETNDEKPQLETVEIRYLS
jgi:predicted phosphodiesterase